jgi:hypothetical protein
MLRLSSIILLLLLALPAFALDWTQPILDEQGNTIPDCPMDPATKLPPIKCDKILTIGMLTARALLTANSSDVAGRGGVIPESPEQKALAGNLGLQIILHNDFVPTPDQLKLARDAIGRLPSPLAVARGWAILDAAVK